MRIDALRARLGALALAGGLLAGCGGEEPEPVDEGPVEEPAAVQPAAPTAGAAPADLPAGVTAEMVAQGQQIYNGPGICYTCHGQNGAGSALAPSLADSEWLWITPGPDAFEQIVQTVKTGVTQPKEHPAPMPAMGGAALNEEQVRAVSAYVYSLGGIQGG